MPVAAAASSANQLLPSFPPQTDVDRQTLIRFIREARFAYGTWSEWKRLYKAVEAQPNADPAFLGALFARMDASPITIPAPEPRLELGQYNGTVGAAARDGYLFLLGGRYYYQANTLVAFSTSRLNLMKPKQIGSLSISTAERGLSVCGSLLAYSVSTNRGRTQNGALHLADVSDPTQPKTRGKIEFRDAGFATPIVATFPYFPVVTAGDTGKFAGLNVYDLSDADNPRIAGSLEIKEVSPTTIAVQGNLVAVVAGGTGFRWNSLPTAGGLRLIDISDPAQPRVVGTMNLSNPVAVSLHGNFVYVTTGAQGGGNSAGLTVIDISDIRHPRKRGFCTLPYSVTTPLSVGDEAVYVVTQYHGVHVVDIRNPDTPVVSEVITNLYNPVSISLENDLAYVALQYGGVHILNVSDPLHPKRVGIPPTGKTIGYMKRRSRRYLRLLAKQDKDRYAAVATELLLALAPNKKTDDKKQTTPQGSKELDVARHWATLDTLFGGGHRYRQTRHGRGRYIPDNKSPRLSLRTREEKVPDAWNAHPELLNRLLTQVDLPIAVYEFAARALRSLSLPLPNVDENTLGRWVRSESPLLIALSVRTITAQLLKGELPAASLVAEVWFRAGAAVRKQLASERASTWASKKSWAEIFAPQLAGLVQSAVTTDLRLSRRGLEGATLLARYFSWAIVGKPDVLLPLVAPFLTQARNDLEAMVQSGAEKATPENLRPWLIELSRVPAERSEAVLQTLEKTVRNISIPSNTAYALTNDTNETVRGNGWRLLAASATDSNTLGILWNGLLSSVSETLALRTAMSSPYALGLLERAGIGPTELMAHVTERPFLVGLLSPEAFAHVTETAPPSVVLSLVAASPDTQWQTLRPIWLQRLRDGIGRDGVWLAAENAILSDNTDRLTARLIGDTEIAETFLAVENDDLLGIRDPVFATLLGRWVEKYADKFAPNSPLLFDAATHPLPEVREQSLQRVLEQGMSMPFALRLLESGVPPSVTVGRTLFDNEPPGGEREPDYALALADSPVAQVREIGRTYITARWETLPHERVLTALFENPAPEVQAFVAQLLGKEGSRPEQTSVFDGEVLRAQNRARVAKERVKSRQTSEPTLDIATLLTIARSRTPRDAEWALSELARRSVNGETIEGITVEGVTGI